jgi:hypothetical protein
VTVSELARIFSIGVLTWSGLPRSGQAEDQDILGALDELALAELWELTSQAKR